MEAADWIENVAQEVCFPNVGGKLKCQPGPEGNKKLNLQIYFDLSHNGANLHTRLDTQAILTECP